MKIRNGFVSNSSSSSFCIYGLYIEEEQTFVDKLIEKGYITKEKFKELGNVLEYAWEKDENNFFIKHNLEVESMDEDSGIYVGKSWSSIKDDETGAEFKKAIENSLIELLGTTYKDYCDKEKEYKCSTLQEAWFNG